MTDIQLYLLAGLIVLVIDLVNIYFTDTKIEKVKDLSPAMFGFGAVMVVSVWPLVLAHWFCKGLGKLLKFIME